MEDKLCITCKDDEEGYSRCGKCDRSKSLWAPHPAYEVGKIEGRRAALEQVLAICNPSDEPPEDEFAAGAHWANLVWISIIRANLEAK